MAAPVTASVAPPAVEVVGRDVPTTRPAVSPTASATRGWRWSVAAIGAVALGLRWWLPGEPLRTGDAFTWFWRSLGFGESIRSGNFAAATTAPLDKLATRPGVTTMWTGFMAQELGAPARNVATFLGWDAGPSFLRLAQMLMATWCGLGIVVFVVVARRLVGARAALIAGGLLAVEPFFVGHSAVLHTDALLTISSGVAVVTLAACVKAHRRSPLVTWRGWWRTEVGRLALLAGVAGAVAGLTKVNAVLLVGSGLLVAFVPVSRRWGFKVPAVITVLSGVAVIVAAWPALWFDPWGQLRACVDSATLAGEGVPSFFMGEVGARHWAFYPVAAWYRASGWLLVAGALSVVWWSRARVRGRRSSLIPRRSWVVLVAPPVAHAVALELSAKHYDRYLLPLLPFAALGIAVCASRALEGIGAGRRLTGRLGWAGLALATAWTASLAPFAISHVDPLVGGQRAAVERIPLSWGEGSETVLARANGPGRCPTLSTRRFLFTERCLTATGFAWIDGSVAPPDYVLVFLADRQVGATEAEDEVLRAHGTLLDEVVIDGVSYAELWRPGRPPQGTDAG